MKLHTKLKHKILTYYFSGGWKNAFKSRKIFSLSYVDLFAGDGICYCEELDESIEKYLPEDHDLKLLVCCENSPCNKMFLISNDGHFIAYANIILTRYKVVILPMQDIRQKMIQWKWT